MQYSALSALRVLEVEGGLAGAYCGRLLAGVGADVVVVEGGDKAAALRSLPPYDADGCSLSFAFLAAGKRSVHAEDAELDELVRTCDLLVTDRSSPQAPDPQRCMSINPRLVYVDISAYGRSGPYADLPDAELFVDALGGWLYGIGRPDREPVKPPGWQSSVLAGTLAAAAGLAAVLAADRSGVGERVEVSRQAAVAWFLMNPTTVYAYSGAIWRRDGGVSPSNYPQGLMPCKDGILSVTAMYFGEWDRMCDLLGQPQWKTDPRLATPLLRRENRAIIDEVLLPWLAERTVRQAYEEAQAVKLPFAVVNTSATLLESEQLAAREFWDEIPLHGKKVRVPGLPFRLSGAPRAALAPAPRPGEESAARVRERWQAVRRPTRAGVDRAEPAALPLAGHLVVDLTMAWAGPLATRVLRELGAEVIKIEGPTHMDRWRGGTSPQRGVERYPHGQPGERPWNRNAFFNSQNRGKRSLSLDLKTAEGKQLLRELVRRSGILVENFGSGAMGRLGLDYEQLREVRPDLVMVSMPAFGRTGPDRNHIAHGPTIEAAAGNVSLQGYEDGEPLPSGAFAWGDPVAGVNGAFAAIAGIAYRAATGKGTHVDLSHLESGVLFNFPAIVDYAATGRLRQPMGNHDPLVYFQAVLPCAGDDRWVAFLAEDEEALARVLALTGADAPVATDQARERLARWTERRSPQEVVAAVRAVERAYCVPVHDAADLLADPALRQQGFYRTVTHPEAGRHDYPGMPWRYVSRPWRNDEAAPCFGEHTVEVLSTVLGLSRERIDELVASGVCGSRPVTQGD